MDRRRIILNIGTSVISRFLLLLSALYVRRLLIRDIGNEYNGLNSLYADIIGVLSVAELGAGCAIVFSMYSPIAGGDREKVSELYCLYRKLYRIIGSVIFAGGLAVMCFLPHLIDDCDHLPVNVYATFFITLISAVLTYLFSAKTALIEAFRDNYVTTAILTVARLSCYALQSACILLWKSYELFLICRIIETGIIWGLTEFAVRKMHGDILAVPEKRNTAAAPEVSRNIRAMFMHKIGTILVNSTDSIIISGFAGVAVLGLYTNYQYLAVVLSGTVSLFFTPLTSIVGHLCATGTAAKSEKCFKIMYCLNYILGVVFFLGYYAVIDSIVEMFFGADLAIPRSMIFILTFSQFVSFMRRTTLLFRDASGTFYNDRIKPVAEGIINLILSLILVCILPDEYCITGVVSATVITTLTICHTVEPYVVFRHVFGKSPKYFYIRNYGGMAVFAAGELFMQQLCRTSGKPFRLAVTNGFLSMLVSLLILSLLYAADRRFRSAFRYLAGNIINMSAGMLNRIRTRHVNAAGRRLS
ncbi:MAG: hypothetical protein K5752_05120 [Succinivibrionaceae bacterium]|nr:hypothetical protein [Succinivibrionaceae bacterium]